MKRLLMGTAIVCGALWFHHPAHAGPKPPDPSPACTLNDITLSIATVVSHPVQCITDLQLNDNGSSPDHERDLMNTAFGTTFSTIGRDEKNNTPSVMSLDGIQFTMTTNAIKNETGSFTLSWIDTNGTALDNLPITIGFEVDLNGGSNSDAYRFASVLLPDAPNNSGVASFELTFHNGGDNVPGLSHITLTAGDDVEVTQQCTTNCVVATPEPSTIALLGLGLLGTIAVAKRKRG